jgi:hypothetical protein
MADRYGFNFGKARAPKIKGYKTPKEGLIAISFAASFDLEVTGERRTDGTYEITLVGECSYLPATKEVSQVEIKDLHSEMADYALYGPGIFFRRLIPAPAGGSLLRRS